LLNYLGNETTHYVISLQSNTFDKDTASKLSGFVRYRLKKKKKKRTNKQSNTKKFFG